MNPNVLLVHCHDLGRFLGCYGHTTVHSPNLDQLAADGVTLEMAFASAPQCSPSRAALFTGRAPHATGVMGLTHKDFGWDLHPEERHLAQVLSNVGYRTELVGVHHESKTQPDDQIAAQLGFDRVVSGGLAPEVAQRTVDLLADLAEAEKPFYLQVGFYEPHRLPGQQDKPGVMGFLGDDIKPDAHLGIEVPPYLHDDEGARTELAELQGAVSHMDAAVGQVLTQLRALGLDENTIVIFTTDHGLALPRAKCTLYDPGLETAMIMRYPKRGWAGGRRHSDLVSNVDVVPTLLDVLGMAPDPSLHGHSLAPLLDGEKAGHRAEIYGELTHHDYYDPKRCIRTERFKLIANFSSAPQVMDPSQSWNKRSTPITEPYGEIIYHPPFELYDLHHDPNELTDLATDEEFAEVVDDLRKRLFAWMRETSDPLIDGAVTPPLHRRVIAAMVDDHQPGDV